MWGAVWELNKSDLSNLDDQEGVSDGEYGPLEVQVSEGNYSGIYLFLYQFFLGNHLWGSVWELNKSDLSNLDAQEGVSSGIYRAMEVQVSGANY